MSSNRILFALVLLLAALDAPSAQAAARFWTNNVGGANNHPNCTNGTFAWDVDSGTGGAAHSCWATTSGGATGAAAPTTADDVTFDANSGTGTVGVAATGAAFSSLTCGAYGGGLDFSAGNASFGINSTTGINCSGAGTRNIKLGSGTFTFSANSGAFNFGTTTGLTFDAGTSTIKFTASACQNAFTGGGLTFATVTFNCSGASGANATISNAGGTITTVNYQPTGTYNGLTFTGAQTITNLNITPTGTGGSVTFTAAQTFTIGTLTTTTSAANPIYFTTSNILTGNATLSAATNQTLNYAAFNGITFAGAGTWTATNSAAASKTSGITLVPTGAGAILGGGI